MEKVLAIGLILLVCVFLFFQIRGFLRDMKKRKKLKKDSEIKLEKADEDLKVEEEPQNEQSDDTKNSR